MVISYFAREMIIFGLTLFFIFAMIYGPIIADRDTKAKKRS